MCCIPLVGNSTPESSLIDLYYYLMYPYLIYGILLWGGSAKVHLQPLIVAQKKIVRVMIHSHYLAHTAPLFHRKEFCNWRTFIDMVRSFGLEIPGTRNIYPLFSIFYAHSNINITSFRNSEPKRTHQYYVGMFKLKINNSVVYPTHTYETRNNGDILPSRQTHSNWPSIGKFTYHYDNDDTEFDVIDLNWANYDFSCNGSIT